MLNFENIEDLVSNMFENLDNEDNLVSVIANKQMIIDIMVELLNYKNVILNSCELDYEEEYDREYIVSLFNDVESDYWYVNVEKCYLTEKEKYVSTEGYVLFHEDVNSKALIDMQNNEYVSLGEHDWFTVGEENNTESDENTENKNEDPASSVTVTVDLDTGKTEEMVRYIDNIFNREISDIFDMLYRPCLYEYRPLLLPRSF